MNKPDPENRCTVLRIGDMPVVAEYRLEGSHLRATETEPEEFPEPVIVRLWTVDYSRDISGLLQFDPLAETVDDLLQETIVGEAA